MYIDAYHDRIKDRIRVVERRNGLRNFRDFPVPYRLYQRDSRGTYRSVYGEPLVRFDTNSSREFYAKKEEMKEAGISLYESDCNLVFRFLHENYKPDEIATLNVAFFDIEVDFDPQVGFANPSDPYAAVNAISVYAQWLQTLITLTVPPAGMSVKEAEEQLQGIENCFVFSDEVSLLDTFLQVIEDADVVSGWNSTGYDIPYLVNRITRVMGEKQVTRLCLWDLPPKRRTYMKYKKEHETFDLIGRVHLDYLDLYEKNTYHEIPSRKLDRVGQAEVGEKKVPYDGTLDQLYKNDFRKFIEYNRQDTMILEKLDQKLKFIELSNTLAHTNGVLLATTMGSVALIDQAIINAAHERGLIFFDKKGLRSEGRAAGAYVADPVVGLHDYVGAIDINSLYPSVIRALNMSPDTIFGQIRLTLTERELDKRVAAGASDTDAWHDIFGTFEYQEVIRRSDTQLTVDFETGKTATMTAAEVHDLVFADDSNLCISANGTLFRTDIEGIIPGLLSRWYTERKEMQAKKRNFDKMIAGVEIDPDLLAQLEAA